MYNVEKWISTTYGSLQKQTYTDFQAYFLDDCSTDKTIEKIKLLSKDDSRINIVCNIERRFSMGNLWINLKNIVNENDFIVIIDGDDWFYNKHVLEKIVSKAREGYDFIHGQFMEYPKMIIVDEGSYSEDVIKNKSYRKDRWRCSGIRAFKGSLWNKIAIDQVTENDTFYEFTADQAYTYPLLENSEGKIYRFEEPIHVYNRMNPINDDKVSRKKQFETELKIRNITAKEMAEIMRNDNLKLSRKI